MVNMYWLAYHDEVSIKAYACAKEQSSQEMPIFYFRMKYEQKGMGDCRVHFCT